MSIETKKFAFLYPGLKQKRMYDFPWAVVCLTTIDGPNNLKLPKELTIATPDMTFHYILRTPKRLMDYDIGFNYKTRTQKVRPYSVLSLKKFNETLPYHVDKARMIFAHGDQELIESILQRPVINVHNLIDFNSNEEYNIENRCRYHTVHNPYLICTRVIAVAIASQFLKNPKTIGFINPIQESNLIAQKSPEENLVSNDLNNETFGLPFYHVDVSEYLESNVIS